ncbi:MAG: class I SAM-dependent methyltransferase [Saprospiraceae bacterium]
MKQKSPIPAFYLDDENAIRQKFGGKSLTEIFEEIHRSNYWDTATTVSGPGSDPEQTATFIEALPALLQQYRVQSLLDAPCGDLSWAQKLDLRSFDYTGIDIVAGIIEQNLMHYAQPNIRFEVGDLTRDHLPRVDLILCRDCLVHFSENNIRAALRNFVRSGSTWLLMTSFAGERAYREMPDGGWRPINFQKDPFNLGPPVETLIEGCTELEGQYSDKALCLWPLSQIREALTGN